MTTYQQEQQTKLETLEALTREVCELLGDGWSVKTYDSAEYEYRAPDIIHTDGRSFDLHICEYPTSDRGKVSVSGNWPRKDDGPGWATTSPSQLYNPQETSPSIKVSLRRGADVIAREIERRFLPEYTRIWGRLVEKVKSDNEWETNKRALFDELREVGGGLRDKSEYAKDMTTSIYLSGSGYGDILVNGPESVDIHLRSVGPELAKAILKAIRAA